jgi:hypothetical protein
MGEEASICARPTFPTRKKWLLGRERYDITSNRWQTESCLPRKVLAEEVCGIVALYQELYVIPGSSLTDLEFGRRPRPKRASLVLQVYNPKKRTWRQVLTKPPIRNHLSFPWAAMCSIRL